MDKYFVSESEKSAVRALFGICEATLQKKVKSLKIWIQQCPHLPLESKSNKLYLLNI